MKLKLPIADCQLPIHRQGAATFAKSIVNRQSKIKNGFPLIEVLVVMILLSLIVLALMAVFNTAQSAFRTGVTQTDVLEGGRATMDLLAADARMMAPSLSVSNGSVNFYATNGSVPLVQPLVGSNTNRVNVLEHFFILSRNNVNGQDIWTGTGYMVDAGSTNSLYPLYRFSASTNAGAADPAVLFNAFLAAVNSGQRTNMSHLMDGVVNLTVRAYDNNGVWMTNGYTSLTNLTVKNALFFPPAWGEVGFEMFSNTLPASVEIDMGVLEDRTLQRAESLGIPGQSPQSVPAQWNYLAQQAGAVHIFRQRVSIPNFDPSAYQ